jgi:thymidylate kinase
MICLDFYGLPGCGKSTVSHAVADVLRRDYDVMECSYAVDLGYPAWIRFFIKLYFAFALFLMNPTTMCRLVRLIRDCNHGFYCASFYKNLLNLAYKVRALLKSRESIIIFDHGLWQSVISLHYQQFEEIDYNQTYQTLLKIIDKSNRYVNIYLKTDIGVSIKRMTERSTDKARLEYLAPERRDQELIYQQGVFNTYPLHDVLVDGNMTIVNCRDYIIDCLNENGCFAELSWR